MEEFDKTFFEWLPIIVAFSCTVLVAISFIRKYLRPLLITAFTLVVLLIICYFAKSFWFALAIIPLLVLDFWPPKYLPPVSARRKAKRNDDWSFYIFFISDFIKHKPNCINYYLLRADAFCHCENYKAAQKDYEHAKALGAPDQDIMHYESIIFTGLGDTNKGLKRANEAIKLNPQDGILYIYRAIVRIEEGNYCEALNDINKAEQMGASPDCVNTWRAHVYIYTREYDKAFQSLDSCSKKEKKKVTFWINRGLVNRKLENFEAALDDYNQALKINPKYWVAQIKIIEFDIITNQFDKAAIDIHKFEKNSYSKDLLAAVALFKAILALINNDSNDKLDDFNSALETTNSKKWDFTAIENWLENSTLDKDKRDKISSMIESYQKKMFK